MELRHAASYQVQVLLTIRTTGGDLYAVLALLYPERA